MWYSMTSSAIYYFAVNYFFANASIELGPVGAIFGFTSFTLPFQVWLDIVVVDEHIPISTLYIFGVCLLSLALLVAPVFDYYEEIDEGE